MAIDGNQNYDRQIIIAGLNQLIGYEPFHRSHALGGYIDVE